ERELPDRLLFFRLAREPLAVGGLVLLAKAEVADDHLVQRAHRLAKAHRLLQLRLQPHRLAREVRAERDRAAVGARVDRAVAAVAEARDHRAPPVAGEVAGAKSTSSGIAAESASRVAGVENAARAIATS